MEAKISKAIQFNYSNALIDDSNLHFHLKQLEPYVHSLNNIIDTEDYSSNEASILLPFNGEIKEKAEEVVSKFDKKVLKYVFVVGIGGSNLGTQAIYSALFGRLNYIRSTKNSIPELIFLDTLDTRQINEIVKMCTNDKLIRSAEEFAILLISKSGTTLESIVNFETLFSQLSRLFKGVEKRIIVITDKFSKLWYASEEKDLPVLEIPKKVGGRYSVFSSVGIAPLLFIDSINIHSLLKGAAEAVISNTVNATEVNIAAVSACITYIHYTKGITLYNSFFFNPDLEHIGKWYRQLVGESIGKLNDLGGKEIRNGITPIISIGTTDLHSMAQLYFGGPKDKLTSFIKVSIANDIDVKIPKNLFFNELSTSIESRDVSTILNSIYKGVHAAYIKNELPFTEIELRDISEYSLGQYLQFKMIEIMYLAKLMNINAFDQPSVEEYKKETKTILKTL